MPQRSDTTCIVARYHPDVRESLVLDPAEQRVLGSLLEKEVTVPASYPLSLNGLRTACNQATSREPITEFNDDQLNQIVLGLQRRGLVRLVHVSGGRGVKFEQRLSDVLDLDAPSRALLTVLLLRGPQAPGELRPRTERLHPFADRGEVEQQLATLASFEPPLVRQLPLLPGQQDHRWIHLLGPVEVPEAPARPRDALADGPEARDARVLASYERIADAYAKNLGRELEHTPFDRWLLDRVADEVGGPIADAGCGTGHITAHLKSRGARAIGFDLSPAMIERARADHPGVRFERADLRRLPRPEGGWAAIIARYSLVHLASPELPNIVRVLADRLRPGGLLSIAVYGGHGVRHVDDWWGCPVDLDFVLHDPDAVRAAFQSAGLVQVEWYLRGSYEHEEAGDRLYVVGMRPRDPIPTIPSPSS